jgi:hypothetical protein
MPCESPDPAIAPEKIASEKSTTGTIIAAPYRIRIRVLRI